MITKIILACVSLVLLIYMAWPQPASVEDFAVLPNSVRSTLDGDVWQVPNVKAYFSNNFRSFVTDLYRADYQKLTGFPFPPLRLNYPPEFAFTAIKDQTQSTYLEEMVYPLRGSLFVNGYEPFLQDGSPRFRGAVKMVAGGQWFMTKATIRYYPSPLWVRLLVWGGINMAVFLLWKGFRTVRHG